MGSDDNDDDGDYFSDFSSDDTDYYSDEEGNDHGAYWLSQCVLRQRAGNMV